MSLVSVIHLSMSFLGKDLFSDIGLQVELGDRIGLVGPLNRTGPTRIWSQARSI